MRIIDLVTIVFHHKVELNLLRLQAMSLRFLEEAMIHTIFIIYHDSHPLAEDLVSYYPPLLRSRVVILHSNTIDPRLHHSSWIKQQIIKIMVSRFVDSDYYLVLDSKNHFVRPVTVFDYFDPIGRPRLFVGKEMYMRKYYNHGLAYFGVECPFHFHGEDDDRVLQTMTPYLFCRRDVINMISYIETREETSFYDFFMRQPNRFTEFYLYSTFLIFSGRISDYHLTPRNYFSIMGATRIQNVYEIKDNQCIKVFGLHRRAIAVMSDEDKNGLVSDCYHNFYDDETMTILQMALDHHP